MIHYRSVTSVITETNVGNKEREKQKRKCRFDEDESPNGVILPVKIVGKEHIGLFFFPQHPDLTMMHLSCITRLLLAVGPPGFTKGG
jgi:hypothetical protein